jgi:inositol-phosphate phosphatase/L-galactose 1-phosphate phosphatase/histidinol-phosphatase
VPAPALDPAATDRFLALAEACADAAGEILVRHFRTAVAVDTKPDTTPVTVADRDAEAAMRALIAGALPDHGIVGEEMPPRNPGAEFTWVIDPIDGTNPSSPARRPSAPWWRWPITDGR